MSTQVSYEITLYLHSWTDKAWMVGPNTTDKDAVWLPKSQCEEVRRSTIPHPQAGTGALAKDAILGTQITLDVPAWLVERNDLEAYVS